MCCICRHHDIRIPPICRLGHAGRETRPRRLEMVSPQTALLYTLSWISNHRDRIFILDGIITVVVAIYGFIVFPDTPYDTKAFYLTDDEKKRCLERIVEDGREELVNHFSLDMFKRAAKTWKTYVLAVLFM